MFQIVASRGLSARASRARSFGLGIAPGLVMRHRLVEEVVDRWMLRDAVRHGIGIKKDG